MDYKQLAGVDLDEYHLVEIIGSGGMSAVYRAYQEELERNVAVKVLSSQLATDTSYITRFNQEAKIAASLEHSHIVPVYDFGIRDEMMYVVMRLLTGGTLRDKMRGDAMNPHEAMAIITAVAQALDYAHGRNIVHRDVKPGNVMFDAQGMAYLVDFGIARATQHDMSLTADNIVLGTPLYMPPEQWQGVTPVAATDQYALAVIAYEMLTGYPAFAGASSQNLMYQHMNDVPIPANQANPQLSPEVALVLNRAMAKSATDRYPLISNFANALRQAIQQPATRATMEHPVPAISSQQAETVMRQPAPQPEPSPQPTYQPPSPTPQAKRDVSNTTFIIGGGFAGLILLTVLVIGGGFALIQFTNRGNNDNNDSGSVVIDDSTNEDVAPTPILPDSPTLTPLPLPDIDIVGLSNAVVSERATLVNEPTIPVRDATFSPDGQVVVSAHGDGTIRFWRNGVATTRNAHADVASTLDFTPNGQFVASGGRDNVVHIWQVDTAEKVQSLTGHTSVIRDLEFSADGTRLATASEDQTIRVWRVSDWSLEATLRGHNNTVYALAFSPDGTLLASGGQGNRVHLWDMTELRFNRYLDAHLEAVRDVDFSPDGQKIVSSSTDNSIKIWDLSSNRVLHSMDGHGRDVWTVVFSPDGAMIASGGRDNNMRLWETTTGNQLQNITSMSGWVLGIDFSADGSKIVTASGDGTVRLWE
jgi:WD40 repeat protein/tRNA A-37 threonylcarbamoyl transferase component Bud32